LIQFLFIRLNGTAGGGEDEGVVIGPDIVGPLLELPEPEPEPLELLDEELEELEDELLPLFTTTVV